MLCMTFSLSCDGGFSFACRCILHGFLDLKGDFYECSLLLKMERIRCFFVGAEVFFSVLSKSKISCVE